MKEGGEADAQSPYPPNDEKALDLDDKSEESSSRSSYKPIKLGQMIKKFNTPLKEPRKKGCDKILDYLPKFCRK
jgi:hypothetical protein